MSDPAPIGAAAGLAAHPLAPAPAPPGVDPAAAAAAAVAASGTSFGLGMRLLSRPRRRAMWAIYAFSRTIDDIADGDLPAAEKHALLDLWTDEIAAVCAGAPKSLLGRALAGPVARHALPEAEFLLLIDGMRMDADGPIVAPPIEALRAYTRRVAGAVGMLSMRVFGAWRGAASERFALALADALQFTNILRDVEEDAAMGRLYLPAEALAGAGVPADPAAAAAHPNLAAVRRELGGLAREEFGRARAEMAAHERLRLAPALAMMGVYEGYLDALAARGFAPGPVRLAKWRKLGLGLRRVALPGRR